MDTLMNPLTLTLAEALDLEPALGFELDRLRERVASLAKHVDGYPETDPAALALERDRIGRCEALLEKVKQYIRTRGGPVRDLGQEEREQHYRDAVDSMREQRGQARAQAERLKRASLGNEYEEGRAAALTFALVMLREEGLDEEALRMATTLDVNLEQLPKA